MTTSKENRGLAIAAFIVVCVLWGTTFLAIRVAVQSMPPMLLTGTRYISAGLILLGLLRMRGYTIPTDRRTLGSIAVVAVLLIGAGNFAVVWAEQWVPSGTAALLVATAPFWAATIESLRRNGERIRPMRLAGIFTGFGGVALLVTPGGAGRAFDRHFIAGAIAIAIGTIAWQGGTIYGKHALTEISPLMSAALQSLMGGVLLTVLGLATGEAPRFHPTARALLAWAYLILFGAVLGYSAYMYAVSKIPSTTMSLYAYVNPVIAVILGSIVLGERLTPVAIAGMVTILIGMAVVQIAKARPEAAAAPFDEADVAENAA